VSRHGSRTLNVSVLGLNALYLVSQTLIARRLGPVAHDALRLQTTMSADKFRGILDSWDDTELAHYRSHLPPDMVHPLIYAASLTASAMKLEELHRLPPALRRMLLVAPWVSAACDYGENVAHLYLLDHRNKITPAMIRTTGTITNTKWALAGACVITLLAGYAQVGWERALGR
jgi:hypothetical protein